MTARKPFPTAHDVARLAGVSQPSVSRAFTVGASISPDARARILSAARDLGYRPNLVARSLTQARSRIVGVVSGNVENPFFAEATDRLSVALEQIGCRILLLRAEHNAAVDTQVGELLSYRVRALVLLAVDLSSQLIEECSNSGIPVILFNRTIAAPSSAFSVTGDNERGARSIAKHLIETGRRKFAFMAGYANSSTSAQREDAFCRAVAEAGFASPRRVVGHFSRSGAIRATRALLEGPGDRPDALFCANDLMAIAALETTRSEFCLRPGVDLAIAGFDDIAMAKWPSFSLTTFSQPIKAMVDRAVDFIGEAEIGATSQSVTVPGKLILRKST